MRAGVRLVVLVGSCSAWCTSSSSAKAYVCGNFAIDCTWPDSGSSQSAAHDASVYVREWSRTLELRYDDGCRTIWRAPVPAGNEAWFSGLCAAGNTSD